MAERRVWNDGSEIRALRPEAITATSPRLLGNGTPCELEIQHLSLAGHDYSVLFYFRSGRLLQVVVSTNGGPSLGDFRAITNALRIRYGDATEYKEDPGGISTGEWLSQDGANVSIVCFPEADVLNINFQCRYLSAAAQL